MYKFLRPALAFARKSRRPLAAALVLAAVVPHVALDAPRDVTVDPATALEFPHTLKIPSRVALPQFTLVGVGVRTVSFLGIKVYSVAFYADLANPNLNARPALSPQLTLSARRYRQTRPSTKRSSI